MNKEQQKKLIIEVMQADEKNGLYSDVFKKETTQTAVDWYYDQTVVYGKTNYAELLEQAKQMEKEQIIKAIEDWYSTDVESAEQYYK